MDLASAPRTVACVGSSCRVAIDPGIDAAAIELNANKGTGRIGCRALVALRVVLSALGCGRILGLRRRLADQVETIAVARFASARVSFAGLF